MPHGVCFNDPSVYYHFGHRLLNGELPYRDYVFQVGPLPIYVDALFQKVFGSTYVASLWASLAIKILRLWVVWLIASRVAGKAAAALLTVFFALSPIFAFSYHWSTPYAQLFISASTLFFVSALREERRRLLHLALAGASAALVVTARQSTAVVLTALLLGSTLVFFWRKVYFTGARLAAVWIGFASALAVFLAALASSGTLGPALKQMFFDGPEKKGIHEADAVLDAILGGSLVLYKFDPGFTWWSGITAYLGLPILVVGAVVYLLSRPRREPSGRTLGLLLVPVAILIASLMRYAVLEPFSDLPRTFLTVTTLLAVASPRRIRRWFGVHPLAAIGLGALPLTADWAMEMSVPGRGWGDATSLVTGALLFFLASRRLMERTKVVVCAGLAAVGVLHFGLFVRAGKNPFAKDDSADGTLAENHVDARHPMLRGVRINEPRKVALEWLESRVAPQSSCFVYGNLPILYDLLACKNPTRIDSTLADFVTNADARAAIADLERNPPEWIIAQEKGWMNPDLAVSLSGDEYDHLNSLNRETSKTLHLGLRHLLTDYDDVGEIADVLGTNLAQQAATYRDNLESTRLYHRRPRLVQRPN